MGLEPAAIETVTFDSYSTLLDVESAAEALDGYADDPEATYRTWRYRSLTYAQQSNFLDNYRSFYELNRLALEYALAAHGVETTADERQEILSVYHDLDPFDDVRDGIARLCDAGYAVYVLSNGDPAMLESLLELTDIADLVEDAISADEVETYKPAVELYRHAAARTGTPIGRIAHATAGLSDVAGGMHAGMRGVWINRYGRPSQAFYDDPDLVVDSIHDLAAALDA